jgi:hypothetical protein
VVLQFDRNFLRFPFFQRVQVRRPCPSERQRNQRLVSTLPVQNSLLAIWSPYSGCLPQVVTHIRLAPPRFSCILAFLQPASHLSTQRETGSGCPTQFGPKATRRKLWAQLCSGLRLSRPFSNQIPSQTFFPYYVQYIGHGLGPYSTAGGAGDDAVPESATGGAREAAGALLLRKQPGKQPKARSQKACLCLWLTTSLQILQSSGHPIGQLSSGSHSHINNHIPPTSFLTRIGL